MKKHRAAFPVEKLVRLASGDSFQDQREPPLRIGDRALLNSDSPLLLIVDDAGETLTAAWNNGNSIEESEFPRGCLHRWRGQIG